MPREPSSTSRPRWADVSAETAASEGALRDGAARRAPMASGIGRACRSRTRRSSDGSRSGRPSSVSVVRPDGRRSAIQGRPILRAGSRWERRIRPAPVFDRLPSGRWRDARLPRPARCGRRLTPRLWELRRGARVRLGPPKGLFTADATDPRRLLLVGTGTGIAPLLSILGTHLRDVPAGRSATRPVVVHGASFATDLAGRSGLAGLASAGRICTSRPVSRPAMPPIPGGATGRLDALLPDIIARYDVDPGATLAFVSGNPSLVQAVRLVLCSSRVSRSDAIRTETWS